MEYTKIFKNAHKTPFYLIGGVVGLGLACVQAYFSNSAEPINPQNLKQSLESECKSLGLDPSSIDVVIDSKHPSVGKVGDRYIVKLSTLPNINDIKHNLAFISNGACDKEFNWSRYLLIDEPKATLYECFGIRV